MGETAMRLSDIAQMVGRRGALSYMHKHGSYVLPALAFGAQLPGTIERGNKRYDDTVHALNRASGMQIAPDVAEKRGDWPSFFGGMGAKGPPKGGYGTPGQMGSGLGGQALMSMLGPIISAPGQGIAAHITRAMGPKEPSMMERVQEKALGALGSSVATAGIDLLKDLASKAMSAVGNIGNAGAREAILKALKKEDIVLAGADDKELMEAYHTMVRFAPTLSTDKNAVRSFLRNAVVTGNGLDFVSIKLLADSERAVTGGNKKD